MIIWQQQRRSKGRLLLHLECSSNSYKVNFGLLPGCLNYLLHSGFEQKIFLYHEAKKKHTPFGVCFFFTECGLSPSAMALLLFSLRVFHPKNTVQIVSAGISQVKNTHRIFVYPVHTDIFANKQGAEAMTAQ